MALGVKYSCEFLCFWRPPEFWAGAWFRVLGSLAWRHPHKSTTKINIKIYICFSCFLVGIAIGEVRLGPRRWPTRKINKIFLLILRGQKYIHILLLLLTDPKRWPKAIKVRFFFFFWYQKCHTLGCNNIIETKNSTLFVYFLSLCKLWAWEFRLRTCINKNSNLNIKQTHNIRFRVCSRYFCQDYRDFGKTFRLHKSDEFGGHNTFPPPSASNESKLLILECSSYCLVRSV